MRHGQYNLKSGELTDLGREQARLTGIRLREMADKGMEDHYGKIAVSWDGFAFSDVARAKETAKIITTQLQSVEANCDPMLAEGWPCIPKPYNGEIAPNDQVLAESSRIEGAFSKYIHRAEKIDEKEQPDELHTFTLIVCHQNVIRYFVTRALQIPPEYWLRFRGDNCGITEIIIYDNGKVSLGKFADVGHLSPRQPTFH